MRVEEKGTGHIQMKDSKIFVFRVSFKFEKKIYIGRAIWNTVYSYNSMFVNGFIARGVRGILD